MAHKPDWKAQELASHLSAAAELGHAQALGHLGDPSRFNRALAALRPLIDEYIGTT